MEAGRKRVFVHTHNEEMARLRDAGLTIEITDPVLLAFHLEVAKHSEVLKDKPAYRCGICCREHAHGERCPNSARKYVRAPDV